MYVHCMYCELSLQLVHIVAVGRGGGFREVKFPTECFHLTAHCHHVALLPTIRMMKRNLKELLQIQDAINEMERSETKHASIPKYKNRHQVLMMRQAGLDGVLIEQSSLSRAMQFYGSLAEWIVSILDPKTHG